MKIATTTFLSFLVASAAALPSAVLTTNTDSSPSNDLMSTFKGLSESALNGLNRALESASISGAELKRSPAKKTKTSANVANPKGLFSADQMAQSADLFTGLKSALLAGNTGLAGNVVEEFLNILTPGQTAQFGTTALGVQSLIVNLSPSQAVNAGGILDAIEDAAEVGSFGEFVADITSLQGILNPLQLLLFTGILIDAIHVVVALILESPAGVFFGISDPIKDLLQGLWTGN